MMHGVCDKYDYCDTARHGRPKLVKFLHENRKEGCTMKAMDWAGTEREPGNHDVVAE